LHEKHGYFDESFKSAGDWEFWLRSSKKEEFLHVNDFLGLYLKSPTSVEHRDKPLSFREFKRVKERYLPYKTELLNRDLQEAKQLSQSGEVRQAIQRIRKILDVERNHLLSLEFIGDLCEKIGDTNLALEIWESASQLEPGNERIRNKIQALTQIESLFNAGAHLADKGSLCEGLRLLSRVLDHDPLHVPTLKKMAEVFEKLGLRGKAGEMRLLIKRGQAQKLLFGHLPFEDNNADYGKAHLLIKKGKTTAGLKILSNLLETNPHHIPTLDLMIKLYEDLKLPQKAEAIRKVRLEAGLMKNLKILTGPSDSESDLPVTVVGDWNPDTKRYK
jgi:tetratricopeptide (TPR) repeat protein